MSAESGANGKAWRGGLRSAKPLGNNTSSRESSAERGGMNGRGRGVAKNVFGSNLGGKGRDTSASWRAKPSGMDDTAPSPFSAFGGTPSSFGTPAFIGGQFRDPFGGSAMAAESSAFPSTSPSLFTSTPPTPSNQISTLEVLGEDTESRKKRFESTLANNRYLEVSAFRYQCSRIVLTSLSSSNHCVKLSDCWISRMDKFQILSNLEGWIKLWTSWALVRTCARNGSGRNENTRKQWTPGSE